jgi:hypothetical protein
MGKQYSLNSFIEDLKRKDFVALVALTEEPCAARHSKRSLQPSPER